MSDSQLIFVWVLNTSMSAGIDSSINRPSSRFNHHMPHYIIQQERTVIIRNGFKCLTTPGILFLILITTKENNLNLVVTNV